MRKLVLIVCILMISNIAFCTTFIPLPIKKQIKESDAVVKGEVILTESEMDTDGEITTKVTILADKWIGVKPQSDFVEVHYLGGKVGPRIQKVEGSPNFEIGEKIVLFTKKGQNKKSGKKKQIHAELARKIKKK